MSASNKETYPSIPGKAWWELRRVLLRRVPPKIDGDYLSTTLGGTPRSAQANIIPGLKTTGLIDEEGVPTDLALRWRDDDEYPTVCEEIRNAIYPPELLDAHSSPPIDRQRLGRWFQQRTRSGESSAMKMAQLFELLAAADPSKQNASTSRTATATAGRASKPVSARRTTQPITEAPPTVPPVELPTSRMPRRPSLHIDVQIHISPESSAQQIDHIFASMAKHLKLNDSSDVE